MIDDDYDPQWSRWCIYDDDAFNNSYFTTRNNNNDGIYMIGLLLSGIIGPWSSGIFTP